MTERLTKRELAVLGDNSARFRQWLHEPDVRADLLDGEPPVYEDTEFKDIPFAQDEFAQMVCRNYDGLTLQEVANIIGLTRERIRQIQEKALDKERAKRAAGEPSLLDELEERGIALPQLGRRSKAGMRKRKVGIDGL